MPLGDLEPEPESMDVRLLCMQGEGKLEQTMSEPRRTQNFDFDILDISESFLFTLLKTLMLIFSISVFIFKMTWHWLFDSNSLARKVAVRMSLLILEVVMQFILAVLMAVVTVTDSKKNNARIRRKRNNVDNIEKTNEYQDSDYNDEK